MNNIKYNKIFLQYTFADKSCDRKSAATTKFSENLSDLNNYCEHLPLFDTNHDA